MRYTPQQLAALRAVEDAVLEALDLGLDFERDILPEVTSAASSAAD